LIESNNGRVTRRIFDVFMFFNELDLLELRFRTLNEVVDFFVITECTETFSGLPKPMFFAENRSRFREFEHKIIYNPISKKDLENLGGSEYSDYISDLQRRVPHKHSGRPAFKLHSSLLREISQRDSGIIALSRVAQSNDIILLSDADEIPNPSAVTSIAASNIFQPSYFQMNWFLYWINNRVSMPWFGTVIFTYDMLKGLSLDMMRYSSSDLTKVPGPIIQDGGWHFSYLGGSEAISIKLKALPYQGMRAEIAKILSRFRPKGWQAILDGNSDLLMQNRTLGIVPLDDSFPEAMYQMTNFVKNYTR
jgi:beta-1,4-mannosyl-glycoprotein beta-1,4-N-acetylglucosaminyltransferase